MTKTKIFAVAYQLQNRRDGRCRNFAEENEMLLRNNEGKDENEDKNWQRSCSLVFSVESLV